MTSYEVGRGAAQGRMARIATVESRLFGYFVREEDCEVVSKRNTSEDETRLKG